MEIPLSLLSLTLVGLLVLSAFFSGSETAMMALDRHRLQHLVDNHHPAAVRVHKILSSIDRLLGVILLGNNFVNILASVIATIIALRLGGEVFIGIATAMLTVVVLIFAEIAPKTMAARRPEKFAFAVSWPLWVLMQIVAPLVILINILANSFLWLIGQSDDAGRRNLSTDELRSIVEKSAHGVDNGHLNMILGMIDLRSVQVKDIIVPKNEIVGINIQDDPESIQMLLTNITYTRLPVYDSSIDQIVGVIHVRDAMRLFDKDTVDARSIVDTCNTPYIIPECTSLLTQLQKFQQRKERMAFVIDEYGNIRGLTTIDDILEEIVGDYTSDIADLEPPIVRRGEGVWQVDGSTSLRDINDACGTSLHSREASTLSGLILELLGEVPRNSLCIRTPSCVITTQEFSNNSVVMAEIKTDAAG